MRAWHVELLKEYPPIRGYFYVRIKAASGYRALCPRYPLAGART